MDKRRRLMQMIANADEKGINKIYDIVNGKNIRHNMLDIEVLREKSAKVFNDIMTEDPTKIFISFEIVEAFVRLENELFKEKED